MNYFDNYRLKNQKSDKGYVLTLSTLFIEQEQILMNYLEDFFNIIKQKIFMIYFYNYHFKKSEHENIEQIFMNYLED